MYVFIVRWPVEAGLSVTSTAFFRTKSVSGRQKKMMTAMTASQIAANLKVHRHPQYWPNKPPMMGARWLPLVSMTVKVPKARPLATHELAQ